MKLEEFCISLGCLNLTHVQQALSILWFLDKNQTGTSASSGELARILRDAGLGSPHSTRLGEGVFRSKHALKSGKQLRIKPTSRSHVGKWVSRVMVPSAVPVDHQNGFLPQEVWIDTATYIEKIANQINGCYQFGFYDGSSVLMRRLVETLLIECYEHLNIESKIKRADGNYPMLSEIIIGAVDKQHLSLGRETKKILKEMKTIGDRSAHNRRYTAVRADLDKIQSGVRLVVDELLHLADLK